MAKTRLGQATFVQRGYGQVEPNHLSAQRNGKIYAQLPAEASINLLENGQFVKYDYAAGVVDFTGPGEWMLVFNEVKVYRDFESDADFAMRKEDYVARVYSPIDGENMERLTQARYYGGVDANGQPIRKVTAPADPWTYDSTDNPFAAQYDYASPKLMKANTSMVPRVFKTDVGDIYTTNCLIGDPANPPAIGATLAPNASGYLEVTSATTGMLWEVVKVYDLGDRQRAVKIMRIQ